MSNRLNDTVYTENAGRTEKVPGGLYQGGGVTISGYSAPSHSLKKASPAWVPMYSIRQPPVPTSSQAAIRRPERSGPADAGRSWTAVCPEASVVAGTREAPASRAAVTEARM